MAYFFYLDKLLLPIAPGKLQLKVENQNKTLTLINEGEINLLKKAGLSGLSFEALLPNQQYPFAIYKSGFQRAKIFLDQLELLKVSQEPFQFIVTRETPAGFPLHSTNIKVSLEDYTINEDSRQGLDVVVSIKLKQYRDYGAKIVNIVFADETPQATIQATREITKAPAPSSAKAYTVVSGDNLWNIAKRFYGDGSKYKLLAEANSGIVTNPNLIYPGQVLTIPAK